MIFSVAGCLQQSAFRIVLSASSLESSIPALSDYAWEHWRSYGTSSTPAVRHLSGLLVITVHAQSLRPQCSSTLHYIFQARCPGRCSEVPTSLLFRHWPGQMCNLPLHSLLATFALSLFPHIVNKKPLVQHFHSKKGLDVYPTICLHLRLHYGNVSYATSAGVVFTLFLPCEFDLLPVDLGSA